MRRQGVVKENMPGHTGDWNMYFTWARAEGEDGVCEQTSWETDNTGHSPEITVDGAPAKVSSTTAGFSLALLFTLAGGMGCKGACSIRTATWSRAPTSLV